MKQKVLIGDKAVVLYIDLSQNDISNQVIIKRGVVKEAHLDGVDIKYRLCNRERAHNIVYPTIQEAKDNTIKTLKNLIKYISTIKGVQEIKD